MTDDQNDLFLTQYLLGHLPPEEADRLDELSVADDAFAVQLSAAENDLVDAYVRGELSAETAEQFKAAYMSTVKGFEKVRFAETFYALERNACGVVGVASQFASQKIPDKRHHFFTLLRFVPQWALAGAAMLLLGASGYLTTLNRRLEERVNRSESERAALDLRQQQLERQLEARPMVNSPSQGTEGAQSSQRPVDQLRIAAFVLVPALRGSSALAPVFVEADTDLVVLTLDLEANEFRQYRASLVDSATRQTVCKSADLKPFPRGDSQAVSFALSKALLQQRNYVVQVEGIRANGAVDLIGSYPFRAVIK